MRAGGEVHAADGHFERALAGVVQCAQLAEERRRHFGIVKAARVLKRSRPLHAGADVGGRFGRRAVTQLLEWHRRHFHVDIDAIQQRPRDLAEVALNDGRRAPALASGIAVEPARAPV